MTVSRQSVKSFYSACHAENTTTALPSEIEEEEEEALQCGDTQRLIRNCQNIIDELVYFVPIEKIFSVIKRCRS